MEAAHDNRRQLGQLMVDEGILTSDQLTQALAEQDRTGQPLGEILVELGFASPGAVANSLAEQHGGLLKTEYGVSAGLRTVSDAGLANAPVRPVIPPPESRQSGEETEGQDNPVGLRVIPLYPPPVDGPPLVPEAVPDPPAQIPNAEEARIADLSARLDDTASKLRASQQAREAFSTRVAELEAQIAAGAPGESASQPDLAQAARVVQLEAHIQQLDEHIKAAAADRETIVQHYTELQAQLAAAQAATPEPDPAQAARVQELETQLQAAAVDREGLVESLTKLQARLGETSQARDAERTEASAGAAARVSVLEEQLKDATQERGILEKRTWELQGALLASEQARAGEIQSAVAEALERVAELEAQLKQAEVNAAEVNAAEVNAAEVNVAEPAAGLVELEAQLQAITAERDAMLAGLAEHEATVATLREHLDDRNRLLAEKAETVESEGEPDSGRVAELEAQLASEQSRVGEIESAAAVAVARVTELEAQLQSGEASDGRAAELEAELTGLREELADRDRKLAERPSEQEPATVGLRALVENVEHEAMAGLREDVADRDRRLAENVNEIARLNRELAESAEREAAMTSLRSELDDRDRQLAERAMLVENVEHDAMTALRDDLNDREQRIARTSEELADRDRQLAEIAEEIARINNAHEATTNRLREELADRERQLAESADRGEVASTVEEERTHVLFIPTQSGYSLLERSGPAPAIGETVEVDGESENAGHFVVLKHGRPVPAARAARTSSAPSSPLRSPFPAR